MSRPKNKDEYRADLAEAFAHILEEKGLEWKKEWHGSSSAPYNGITKAHYRGINAFYLSLVAMSRGYTDPRWVTMVQIMDRDGKYHPKENWHLQEGSKAVYVEYWYPYDPKDKKALTWEQYGEELRAGRSPEDFFLRTKYTAVFNGQNVDGMPELEKLPEKAIKPDQIVGTLSRNMGVPISYDGGDRAYYSPLSDSIHLPPPGAFENDYAFNATALHELAHSTGHISRLNRSQIGAFGSAAYAYEELVAEMSSCFMGAGLTVQPTEQHINNHKAYVQSWVQAVRNRPETLVKAIKDAQTAANYMDWKSELITEAEYLKDRGSAIEVNQKNIESDAVHKRQRQRDDDFER